MSNSQQRAASSRNAVRLALARCVPWFFGIAVFSALINILYLTSSIYMLQIYDRVMPSRSVATLVGISAIVLFSYMLQGGLDAIRSRMLARVGAKFDALLTRRVYAVTTDMPLRHGQNGSPSQPLRDLDAVRSFLSGLGPTALFDTPFIPLFMAGAFLLHPWLGWLTVAGGVLIIALTVVTEMLSRQPVQALNELSVRRQVLIESSRRNAETLRALGMRTNFSDRFQALNHQHVRQTLRASDTTGGLGAIAKMVRAVLQSASLGLGAYLAINGEISAGSMIAASILTSRALAPIEVGLANWKGFVAARQGYGRLKALLPEAEEPKPMALPKPVRMLSLNNVSVAAPGTRVPIVSDISVKLDAGSALGIIGPSASGKSTLARAIVGAWPLIGGAIRIDGASLDQWGGDLGRHLGYLAQDVELFAGTIGENISRFDADADPSLVIKAAREAGAHDMIVAMPGGYNTQIGEGGTMLSGGQRQRIALARALYGDPFVVVLDEPNANLDNEGERALEMAIRSVRERGGVMIVITHRPAGLAAVDLVAVMMGGQLKALGPRDEVMQSLIQPVAKEAVQPQRAANDVPSKMKAF